MANELASIKRLLRTAPEDPNIVQEQDWDGLVNTTQSALDQKAPLASPKFATRLDLAAANFSASFRDDGAGNLAWMIGAAGAADGAQVTIAQIEKAGGTIGFGAAPSAGNRANFGGPILVNAGLRLSRFVGNGQLDNPMDNTAGRSLDLDCSAVTTNSVDIRVLRGTNSTGTKRFTIYAGDGSATSRHTLYGAQVGGVSALLGVGGGTVGIGAVGTANFTLQVDGTIGPNTDNVRNLGSASFRMATIFAGTGAINTSDATLKSLRDGTLIGLNFKVSPLEAVEVAAARDLLKEIGVYKFLDAVAEKGEGARLHIGLTVQRGIQIMEAHGLDPWAYGIFCRDAITRRVPVTRTRVVEKIDLVDEPESTVEIRDGVPTLIAITRTREVPVIERRALVDEGGQAVIGEDGEQVFCDVPVMVEEEFVEEVEEAAGERLGFRYDQLNMFLIAALAEAVTGGH